MNLNKLGYLFQFLHCLCFAFDLSDLAFCFWLRTSASLIDGFKMINKRCLNSTSSIWFVVYPAVWSLFWNWTQFCVMLIHILVCIFIFGTHTLSLFLSFSLCLCVNVFLSLALIQTIFLDLCWCLFVFFVVFFALCLTYP